MHLQLPTRFVLLDRAIATLGSVGMELYPDFNVFDVAKPYARELLIERFTPQRIARRTGSEARNMASMLHELPYQVHDTLEQVRDGQIEVGFRHEGLEDLFARHRHVFNRVVIAVVAVGGALTLRAARPGVRRGRVVLRDPLGRRLRASRGSSASGSSGASSAPAASSSRGPFSARPA